MQDTNSQFWEEKAELWDKKSVNLFFYVAWNKFWDFFFFENKNLKCEI